MVQVTRYARRDTTTGALDAGHQAPSAEKGIIASDFIFEHMLT